MSNLTDTLMTPLEQNMFLAEQIATDLDQDDRQLPGAGAVIRALLAHIEWMDAERDLEDAELVRDTVEAVMRRLREEGYGSVHRQTELIGIEQEFASPLLAPPAVEARINVLRAAYLAAPDPSAPRPPFEEHDSELTTLTLDTFADRLSSHPFTFTTPEALFRQVQELARREGAANMGWPRGTGRLREHDRALVAAVMDDYADRILTYTMRFGPLPVLLADIVNLTRTTRGRI